jgi:predicted alpha/beta hydrolase
MARGAEQQTINATNAQLAQQNATNQQLLNQNTSLFNQITPAYQNLLANPGYTSAQQAAILGQSMGALGSTFNALQNNAANRAARTNNAAGYNDLLDQLARQYGTSSANVAQQAQVAFANKAQSDQLAALQGLSGIYGTDSSLLGRAMGIPSDLLGVLQRASQPTNSFKLGFGPGGISLGAGISS